MDFPVSRELRAIDSAWSTPQLIQALRDAISGDGSALSVKDLGIRNINPDVALIVSTSGSTGAAKDVLLSGDALLTSARATHDFLGANKGSVWSILLPTSHIAGINVIVRSIDLGSTPVGISDAADFSAIVPTQLFRALNGDELLLKHLTRCSAVLVGGGPLSEELRERATQSGIRVVTTYGMTETCGGVVYDGEPLAGVDLKIIEGRIGIKARQLAISYLQGDLPMRDGYFITSDQGRIVNNSLEIIGRIDDQIISGGEKLSLSAIESFLQGRFGKVGIAAFARKDEQWGDRLCIASTEQLSVGDIADALKIEFGRHASPKEVIFVREIPYLSLGKPDRKKLADEN